MASARCAGGGGLTLALALALALALPLPLTLTLPLALALTLILTLALTPTPTLTLTLTTDPDPDKVRRRRWRMDACEAAAFLATSWGSAAGDRERRFFSEMVRFYCSGDVLALLLEKDGAIGAWRTLLGPGDPAVARGYTDRFGRVHRAKAPHSVRALYGTNKQANAAHGADSPEAARREISLIFGAELVEPQELARL